MIKIIMFEEKWQLTIGDQSHGGEVFVFNNLKEMKDALDKIISMKEKFGRLKK